MSELAAVAAVLRSVADVAERGGALMRLCNDLHVQELQHVDSALRDLDIRTSVFSGMPETPGAGADASLLARLPDGRRVSWMVEVWIDTWEPGGAWSAVVKGDVDRWRADGSHPEDECLFLEQRTVHDVAGLRAAVLEMGDLVIAQDVRRATVPED